MIFGAERTRSLLVGNHFQYISQGSIGDALFSLVVLHAFSQSLGESKTCTKGGLVAFQLEASRVLSLHKGFGGL